MLGHSWAGALAMAWAVAEGETLKGTVTLAGATMPWGGDLSWFYNLAASRLAGPPTAWLVQRVLSEGQITDLLAETFAPQAVPEGYPGYIGGPLATRPPTLRANARDLIELNAILTRQSTRYAHIACPVEILHGTADDTVGHQVHAIPANALIPKSRLTLLDGQGHMPHHTAPDEVEAAITRLAAR